MMPYTQEQENYFKLITLIYCFGAKVNRELLQKFIHSTNTTLEQFINDHQHEIYHFFSNVRCCQCNTKPIPLAFSKVINQKQMLIIFENGPTDRLDNHEQHKTGQLCCLKASKSVDLKDLDFTLIRFFLVQFCYQVFWDCHLQNGDKTFSAFLEENVHKVYHLSVDKINCCMCNADRDIPKKGICETQFEKIYKKGSAPCQNYCSCQYSIQSDVTLSLLIQRDIDLTAKLTKYFCSCRKCLETIYANRNKIAHPKESSIDNDTFLNIWSETATDILKIANALNKYNQYFDELQELRLQPSNKDLLITVLLNLLKTSEHVDSETLQTIEGKVDSNDKKLDEVFAVVKNIQNGICNNENSINCCGFSIVNGLKNLAIAVCKDSISESHPDKYGEMDVSFSVNVRNTSKPRQLEQGKRDNNLDLEVPPDNLTCGGCKMNFTKINEFSKHKETCSKTQVKPTEHNSSKKIIYKMRLSGAGPSWTTQAMEMFQNDPDSFDTDTKGVCHLEKGCLIVWVESSQSDLENAEKLKESCIQLTKNMFQKCPLDSTETAKVDVAVKFSKIFEESLESEDDGSDCLECGTCGKMFFNIKSFITHKKECVRNRGISKIMMEDVSRRQTGSEVSTKEFSAMAESDNYTISITKGEINFFRIISLLLRIAPSAVRVLFDKEFNPTGGLERDLKLNRYEVLEPLRRGRVINLSQWGCLYPMSGTVSSTTFDMTLMMCLIRHLTPIQIGDILPHPTDISDGADLSRLQYYRNIFVNHDWCTLTDENFEIYWKDICQAILRVGGPQFKRICDELKDRILKNNDKNLLVEIRNLELILVPKSLQEIQEDLIHEWGDDDDKVVKTRAISRIEELLISTDVIVVVGPSGCGKSTAIHHVALRLQNQQGYKIVPVHSPDDIIRYCEPTYKQVFVIDDVCGKSTIDIGLVYRWTTCATNIKQVIEDHKIKILLSCRKHIYLDRSFAGVELLSKTACDLVSSYSLTQIERYQIARTYLTDSEINAIKQSGLVEKFSFFPLLCSLYSKQKLTGVQDFFANPISVIRNDLELLKNAADQTTFATMSLFIAFNNSLDENVLSKSHDMTELLDAISDHFDLTERFSINVVKSELHKLEMSYVKKTVSTYRILYNKIYDIFLAFCGEYFFDLVLEIAHKNVIHDRFLLESIHIENQNLKKYENDIKVSYIEEKHYFKRILKDIQKGFIKDIFLNRQFKYLTFRNKLFFYLRLEIDITKVLLQVSSEDLSNILLSMTRECYWDMVPILLTEHVDVNVRDWKGTPLYFASEKGNVDIANLLLDHHADPNIQGWLEKDIQTPLHVAVEIGNINLVKLLLGRHANANIKRFFHGRETPLQLALQQQNDNMVKVLLDHKVNCNLYDIFKRTPLYETVSQGNPNLTMLLLNHGADPNLGEKNHNNTPLHVAFSKGNFDIVKILLDYKADPTIKNGKGETPLFRAVENNHTEIVIIQLNHKSDLNLCNNENESLLFKASRMGHSNIVKLLLENDCDSNVCNKKNESPLFISSMFGHAYTVKLLLEHNCDPNICNDENISPLFTASIKGYIDIVKLLLQHNCDPNICNDRNESPLFIASKEGHTDIVKLLLEHNCNPNVCNSKHESALCIASKNAQTDIVKLLRKHNCDPNMCSDT